MSSLPPRSNRSDYPYQMNVPTRWGDNDMLGHLNNVVYYRLYEAIVVKFMTDEFALSWQEGTQNAQAVESLCRFHKALSFPDEITVGLRVAKIGNSSMTFEVALFAPGDNLASATGHVVEVLVDTVSGKSTPMNGAQREALKKFFLTENP